MSIEDEQVHVLSARSRPSAPYERAGSASSSPALLASARVRSADSAPLTAALSSGALLRPLSPRRLSKEQLWSAWDANAMAYARVRVS